MKGWMTRLVQIVAASFRIWPGHPDHSSTQPSTWDYALNIPYKQAFSASFAADNRAVQPRFAG